LDIYVDAYGLTYLRVYALIWMGVVAAGLVLIGWQVWFRRANGWLVLRGLGLCLAVLYVSAFVNFAAVIARHNLGGEVQTDWDYVCGLGPMAAAEIAASEGALLDVAGRIGTVACLQEPQAIEGWRDWGARSWRVGRAVQAAGLG
jgi:hypothetical protein